MIWSAKMFHRLLKSARNVVSIWENTFVMYGNSLMMIVGGRDRFFHCKNCGACYDMGLLNKHSCSENCTKNCCPVCYEVSMPHMFQVNTGYVSWQLLDLEISATEMSTEYNYETGKHCPDSIVVRFRQETMKNSRWFLTATICRESVTLDDCNDCNKEGKAMFHILGHKCGHCGSYNTRRISSPQDPV